MGTSSFQEIKLQIVELLGMSKDAIHIHIGMSVFFISLLVLGKGRIALKCLLPVFIVAFGMEVIDLIDDYNSVGYFRWINSLHDFINTSFWPVVIVVLERLFNRSRSKLN